MQFPNKSRLSHISLRSQRCKPTRHWRPSLPWEPSGRHQFLHLNWVFHTFWDSIFPASLVAWALASNSKFLPSFPLVIILLGPNGGLLYKWSPLTPRLASVQFSSVTQSCPTLCDPMDCSTPGLPPLMLSSPSPPTFNRHLLRFELKWPSGRLLPWFGRVRTWDIGRS